MEYNINESDAGMEIELKGRLGFQDNEKFRTILKQIEQASPTNCVFNLQRLEFMDSVGLGMFALARNLAKKNDISLAIKAATGPVREILEITEFDTEIPLID